MGHGLTRMDTDKNELPKGWVWKRLGEVITLEYGKPLEKNKRSVNGKYSVYGANGVKAKSDYYYYDKPSLIVGRKGSAGEVNIADGKFWPLDVTYFVKFNEKKNDLFFLYHLLLNLQLQKLAKGVKPGLNRNDVYSIFVPLPPLSEQKRIVAIIDEAFAAIDKAKANAEKNLANAKELFESYLNGIFANPGDDWEEKKLGEVYDVRDGTHDSPRYQDKGYPLITSKNLKDGVVSFDKIKYISETDYININKRSNVDIGDVLFAMIGTIGNPVVIIDDPRYAIKNVALFKVDNNKQNSWFLKYYLESSTIIKKMEKDSKGTTQKFVGLGYIRNFKLLFPPLSEQKRIVAQLDTLSTETKHLQKIYNQKLTALEELKKSILKKAFEGEL